MENIKMLRTTLDQNILCNLSDDGDTYTLNSPLQILERIHKDRNDQEKIELVPRPYLTAAFDTKCTISKQHVLYVVEPNNDSKRIYEEYLDFLAKNNTFH